MIVWIKGNNVYSFLLSSNLVFKIFYILICVFIFDILLDLNISEFDVMFVWWRSSIKRLVFFLSKIVGFVFVDLMVVRVINILVLVFVCFVLIFFFIIFVFKRLIKFCLFLMFVRNMFFLDLKGVLFVNEIFVFMIFLVCCWWVVFLVFGFEVYLLNINIVLLYFCFMLLMYFW